MGVEPVARPSTAFLPSAARWRIRAAISRATAALASAEVAKTRVGIFSQAAARPEAAEVMTSPQTIWIKRLVIPARVSIVSVIVLFAIGRPYRILRFNLEVDQAKDRFLLDPQRTCRVGRCRAVASITFGPTAGNASAWDTPTKAQPLPGGGLEFPAKFSGIGTSPR